MTDITKLAYEKITDRYYKARYLGLECIMDTTNGYINATNLCLSTKDKSKRIVKYIDGLRCKILINYYNKLLSSDKKLIYKIKIY